MTTVPIDAGFEGASDGPELSPAPARELRRLMKDWRSGRATTSLWQAFHNAYIVVIAALMIGAMIVNVIIQAQTVVAACTSSSCLSARAMLPWAAFALSVAAALAASRLFGPVLASAAEGSWLLATPVSRPALLGRRLISAIVAGVLAGAVIGAVVSALTGSDLQAVLIITAATALSTSAAVAFAAAQQGKDRRRLTRFLTYVFTLAGLAALLTVIGVSAGWFASPLSTGLARQIGVAIGGVAALALIAGVVLARLRIRNIRRARLVSGGSLIRGVSGAFFALDIGLARDILVARRAMEIGHVKPTAGKGSGLSAITWREWQRVRRFPQPLIVVAGTIIVPYAADALGMSVLSPVVGALALFGALIPMLGGLRVLTRTGGLARALPFSLSQLKMASIVVPAVVAVLWAIGYHSRLPRLRRRRGDPAGPGGLGDGAGHGRGRSARRRPLDPGQGHRLRGADGVHPGRRDSAGDDDQPVPRFRRRAAGHLPDAARRITAVVVRDRRDRGRHPAQLDGRRDAAGQTGPAAEAARPAEEGARGRPPAETLRLT